MNAKGPPFGGPFFLAGGLGFEPRLTESESAVLPLDDPPRGSGSVRGGSALRVLRAAPRLATTNLLALDLARIAGHEPGSAQRLAQRLVVLDEGAGGAGAKG